MPTDRREFLKLTLISAGVLATRAAWAAPPPTVRRGDMLYRPLGQTGEQVSILGVGGAHLGGLDSDAQATRIVRAAMDGGVTFLDNCWDYHGGVSELRMGKALLKGYRERAFLMTKVDGRDKQTAAKQLDESLRRLRTDHLDLLQVHEVIRVEDPDRVFAPGGAAEALLEAKRVGKTRFLGFTGHKDPLLHLRMLDAAARAGFPLDTVQMPLNVMDAHFRSFEHQVLPRLVQEGLGVLGMKSMGGTFILQSGTVSAVECLHYAMSLPVSVVITGMDSMAVVEQDLAAVRSFQPLTPEQVGALLARTAAAAKDGAFERFKTSELFDGTARHPEWLG